MKWYKYDIRYLTDEEYTYWYSLMNADKKKRVDRYRFFEDKKRTIAGEMLARQAIAEWCCVTPESIAFDIKEHGKPYAKDLAVEFNISHSGNIVMCAVSNSPIGLDIEEIRPVDISVIKRVCNNDELKYALQDNSYKRFFEIWTFKEAYFKCIGIGITDFSSVNYFHCERKMSKLYFDNYIVHIVY